MAAQLDLKGAFQVDPSSQFDVTSFSLINQNGLVTHYFLDPTNGSDSNNGLTALTAWKTLAFALFSGLPQQTLRGAAVLKLLGNATIDASAVGFQWPKFVGDGVYVDVSNLWNGKAYGGLTIYADPVNLDTIPGADIVSTTHDAITNLATVTVVAGHTAWVAGAFAGKVVRDAGGQICEIKDNGVHTLTLCQNTTALAAPLTINDYGANISATSTGAPVTLLNCEGVAFVGVKLVSPGGGNPAVVLSGCRQAAFFACEIQGEQTGASGQAAPAPNPGRLHHACHLTGTLEQSGIDQLSENCFFDGVAVLVQNRNGWIDQHYESCMFKSCTAVGFNINSYALAFKGSLDMHECFMELATSEGVATAGEVDYQLRNVQIKTSVKDGGFFVEGTGRGFINVCDFTDCATTTGNQMSFQGTTFCQFGATGVTGTGTGSNAFCFGILVNTGAYLQNASKSTCTGAPGGAIKVDNTAFVNYAAYIAAGSNTFGAFGSRALN